MTKNFLSENMNIKMYFKKVTTIFFENIYNADGFLKLIELLSVLTYIFDHQKKHSFVCKV